MAKLLPVDRIDVLEFAAIVTLYAAVSALAEEARHQRARADHHFRHRQCATQAHADAPEPTAAAEGALSEP